MKKFANANTLHNVLNVASVVLAGVTAAMLASGCTQSATGTLSCSASWIDPTWAAVILSAIGVLKLAVNVGRDGFGGLIKRQPPVEK